MRIISCIALSVFLLVSCKEHAANENKVDESLLDPVVVKAKKFVAALENNDRKTAMIMVFGYSAGEFMYQDIGKQCGEKFDILYAKTHGRKLKPLNTWTQYTDTLVSESGNYILYIDEVIMPFEVAPQNPDDPAYLYVGFQKELDTFVHEFNVMTKDMTGEDGHTFHFIHTVSAKQDRMLREF